MDLRPWLTRDRAPSALPERAWPQPGRWDLFFAGLGRAVLGATRRAAWRDRRIVALALRREAALARLDDAGLARAARDLRPGLLAEGFAVSVTATAFALVREAAFRTLGFRHHRVQMLGALQILRGRIAEMATGEGKTATAALAAATVALAGQRVHVITVNEYLSERDHEELRPLYALLGLGSAYVPPDAEPAQKRAIYAEPVVYVTNKTLVFDYLRSRLGRHGPDRRQRRDLGALYRGGAAPATPAELAFCIVDEADSILIDEAQTPLVIAAPDDGRGEADCLTALEIAAALEPGGHYRIEAATRRVTLTPAGKDELALRSESRPGLWRIEAAREELAVQALSALHLYHRDQQYILVEDKIQIVDEFTGRVLADRQWQAGLHQMVEVKEGLAPGGARRTLAQITFQRFFRRYLWFGGMTGTVAEVAREMRGTYGTGVTRIPTHRRLRRREGGVTLWGTAAARDAAVARRVAAIQAAGRPVLVGTRSVAGSEAISAALTAAGIEHVVLNARQDADEAAVIGRAGQSGAVTVATNMAGRGTDIRPDAAAIAAGGLHVLLTEFHESARIDRQFYGRAGRQGDPGWQEAAVSLEDELFLRHAPWLVRLVRLRRGRLPGWLAGVLRRRAQASAGGKARRNREDVLRRGDRMEKFLSFTRPEV